MDLSAPSWPTRHSRHFSGTIPQQHHLQHDHRQRYLSSQKMRLHEAATTSLGGKQAILDDPLHSYGRAWSTGKASCRVQGCCRFVRKTSNPWRPTPQLWQSVIDWESKLSRPRVLPVRTKKQAIPDDPLHSYGRAWSIGKASCAANPSIVQKRRGGCLFGGSRQRLINSRNNNNEVS